MYPPILVLVLALVSFSKQALSLSQFDGDEGGGGGEETGGGTLGLAGSDFSSPLYEESYAPDQLPLDDAFYRVTSEGDEDAEDSDRVAIASSSSSTTTTTTSSTTSELPSTATDRSSAESDHITDSDGKISVAQPFIGEHHPQEPPISNRSRSLDHDTADSLQSSTVLETSLASNFLYTSSGYNDSGYHLTATVDSDSDSDSEGVSSLEDLATTTNLPPLAAIPDDVAIAAIKPTKPHFDESKISKSELLARMIGDKNLRLPIAILVDTCNDSLAYSKKVFDASLVPKSPLDVILMRYNSTAIAKSTSFRNTKSLMDAINSLQPSYESSGRGYYGIMRTAQEIPYDSAIFLATSNAATDQELSKMAAITVLKKRIRLYVIWFGDEEDSTLSDQHLDSQTGLHELAYKTGGRVIRFEIDRHFGNNPVLTTLVSEDDLHGAQSIPIPVGEDVNSLYFKLQGSLESATLRTPNGD